LLCIYMAAVLQTLSPNPNTKYAHTSCIYLYVRMHVHITPNRCASPQLDSSENVCISSSAQFTIGT
jgi:hypothetical protein